MSKQTIALVGGTGRLGALIGNAVLDAYLPLMYYRSVLNGEGKLDELMNDRYPSIRPTTVREYVVKEGL